MIAVAIIVTASHRPAAERGEEAVAAPEPRPTGDLPARDEVDVAVSPTPLRRIPDDESDGDAA